MPTITLKVPPETAARLARMASRRRVAKSVVVREALDEKLRQTPDAPSLFELMGSAIGAVDGKLADRGHNPDHLNGFGRK